MPLRRSETSLSPRLDGRHEDAVGCCAFRNEIVGACGQLGLDACLPCAIGSVEHALPVVGQQCQPGILQLRAAVVRDDPCAVRQREAVEHVVRHAAVAVGVPLRRVARVGEEEAARVRPRVDGRLVEDKLHT